MVGDNAEDLKALENPIATDELESIATEIKKLSENGGVSTEGNANAAIKRDVLLFFSFDVVNSTAYKTVNYYGWAQVLNILFKSLREEVLSRIDGSELWRVLGDEAIFIVKIRDEEKLQEYINRIFKIMVYMIYRLKRGELFSASNTHNFNLMKMQNILSLKTAAWIAVVNNIGNISEREIVLEDTDNLFERYSSQEGYEFFEFLGNDIDTGFRIASQVQDGRMVLSFELAYLISRKTQSLSYIHIITFKRLKGVWKDKLYPVIWYHDPNAYLQFYERAIAFDESFRFDDCVESDLIKEYYRNHNMNVADTEILDKRMYVEVSYALDKILRDRGLESKIDRLQQHIKDATIDRAKFIDLKKQELHCAAVCYQIEDEQKIKILVAKRKRTRKKLSGKWEFGCSKATLNKRISEQIKEDYLTDFGVDIEPVLDKTRELQEPIPLALYSVAHDSTSTSPSNSMDKGIIVLAQIRNSDNLKQCTKKHDEIRWIEESDIANIEEKLGDMVPDFKQTLQQAFAKIKEIHEL